MAAIDYGWTRYWYPRGAQVALESGGFLINPQTTWGQVSNQNVAPLTALTPARCLVLLGEPGMGKSFDLAAAVDHLQGGAGKSEDKTLLLNLRSFSSIDRLERKLIGNPIVQDWISGSHQLHLFLDSFDECRAQVGVLPAFLIDELKELPVERLFLRIACRAADWPSSVEDSFKRFWQEPDDVGAFVLAPLRRVDVKEAAIRRGVQDLAAFMAEIGRARATPLAVKPVTLELLIAKYLSDQQLPTSQVTLYGDGCRALCQETLGRLETGLRRKLTASQRLSIATRIAAIMAFTNRDGVGTGQDGGYVPDDDVTIPELVGGTLFGEGGEVTIDVDAINETLDTGLFSSGGPDRLIWSHPTILEFLAAHCVAECRLPLDEVVDLVTAPEGGLIPQLHETVAWVASMREDVYRYLLMKHPNILLRSDVSNTAQEDKSIWVERLLDLFERRRISRGDWSLYGYFHKLCHEALGEQLQPFLTDKSKPLPVREAAIDIARACSQAPLIDALVTIALDSDERVPTRVSAAYGVIDFGDSRVRARLKPLLNAGSDDYKDQLKGIALTACWPDHISAEELFAILTLPDESFLGAYRIFFDKHLTQGLKTSEIPVMLAWIERISQGNETVHDEFVMGDLLVYAWPHLGDEDVDKSFASITLDRIKRGKVPLGESRSSPRLLAEDEHRRRRLLQRLVPLLEEPSRDAWLVIEYCGVQPDDLPWMIARLKEAASDDTTRAWAELVKMLFMQHRPKYLEEVLIAREEGGPELREVLAPLFDPIRLDSPEAARLRESHEQQLDRTRKIEAGRKPQPLLDPPPDQRIADAFTQIETGEVDKWWWLTKVLSLEPDSPRYGHDYTPDLTALPGWKAADVRTRQRIIKAAETVVREYQPRPEEWVGTKQYIRADWAGYHALELLWREVPARLEALPKRVWDRWAAVIVAYRILGGSDDEEPQHHLVRVAYEHNSAGVIDSALKLLDAAEDQHDVDMVMRKLAAVDGDALNIRLLDRLRKGWGSSWATGRVLRFLLGRGVVDARTYAAGLLADPLPDDQEARDRATASAVALIESAKDAGWSIVWPMIQANEAFSRDVLTAVAWHDYREQRISTRLSEAELAALYVWMVRQYPHDTDPDTTEPGTVTDRFNRATDRGIMAHWRDAVLSNLKWRGTAQACEAIAVIAEQLPELDWIRDVLVEASEHARRLKWTPNQPSQIRDLLDRTAPRPNRRQGVMLRMTKLFIVHGTDERTKRVRQ